MPGLKITLLQQPLVWMDGPANLRHFDRQLEGITGRDVIVLPEMFTSGFAMEAAASSLAQDDVVNWMTAKAQQCNALIAGSVALQTESGSVNRFLLVEPGGTVHFYDKRHLFRMADITHKDRQDRRKREKQNSGKCFYRGGNHNWRRHAGNAAGCGRCWF